MTHQPEWQSKTCETCRWWGRERQFDMDYPYGSCRVRPPLAPSGSAGWKPLTGADGTWDNPVYIPRAYWPWSAFDDWCGEHQPTPPNAGAEND